MRKRRFSEKFEDQTPQVKALVTAIADAFDNGDVDAAWAAIVATPGPEDIPPLEEPHMAAHVQLRLPPREKHQ